MRLYRANIVHTPKLGKFEIIDGGYIAVRDGGTVEGTYKILPEKFKNLPVEDFGGKLLIPGFVDLHLHSSQLPNAGLGYDCTFPEWLDKFTYPVERKYADLDYAGEVNRLLIRELYKNGITRAVIMCPTSADSTADLIRRYTASGLSAFIGKMNSDISPFGDPAEKTVDSISGTNRLIEQFANRHPLVQYALAPEFIPCCSDKLMAYLGEAAKKYSLPVQSHFAESTMDTKMVFDRYGENYGSVYRRFGLFGKTKTVMAHAIFADEQEIAMMRENGVCIAHCPLSNLDIPSERIMPLRHYLESGVHVGLGSDVGGGHTLNVMSNMVCAMQCSKLVSVSNPSMKPISTAEAFFLATKGGGFVFGKVGSFEKNYAFDALVIDDGNLCNFKGYTTAERIDRFIYKGDDRNIVKRFCAGKEIVL